MITTNFDERFSNVLSHQPSAMISSHPEHKNAKNGDLNAALHVVIDLIDSEKIASLKETYSDAILVPVIGIDDNRNKLPLTYAMVIRKLTGLKVITNIRQINETKHTQKGALERLLSRACFSGNVIPNKQYILVDDVITTGGILNELRNYIEINGGKVVAATIIAHAQFSTVFSIQKDTISMIERKFGRDETEKFIREIGIGEKIENITNSEGRYILSFSSINRIRDRILGLGNGKGIQVLGGNIRENAYGGNTEEKISKPIMNIYETISKAKEKSEQKNQELNKQLDKISSKVQSR